jgi:hypothetical protein
LTYWIIMELHINKFDPGHMSHEGKWVGPTHFILLFFLRVFYVTFFIKWKIKTNKIKLVAEQCQQHRPTHMRLSWGGQLFQIFKVSLEEAPIFAIQSTHSLFSLRLCWKETLQSLWWRWSWELPRQAKLNVRVKSFNLSNL